MNPIKSIRTRLGVSQSEFAEALGVTQGNVSFYEKGQTVPPSVAGKVIDFARTKGVDLSYDHVYGAVELAPASEGGAA